MNYITTAQTDLPDKEIACSSYFREYLERKIMRRVC